MAWPPPTWLTSSPPPPSRPWAGETLTQVTDITEAAKSIRLGLYEAVLNAFAHLPVYVVTVAGETSMGKSFLVRPQKLVLFRGPLGALGRAVLVAGCVLSAC